MELFALNHLRSQHNTTGLAKAMCEYLLVIPPDNVTLTAVTRIKNQFTRKYGCKFAAGYTPHITLSNFLQLEMNEKSFVPQLASYFKGIEPFDVTLDGFGNFDRHTIYVRAAQHKAITHIKSNLQKRFKDRLRIDKRLPAFIVSQPHMSIARGMSETQFIKAWKDWEKQSFKGSFKADHLLLLKKDNRMRKYRIAATFNLEGNGAHCEQISLPF